MILKESMTEKKIKPYGQWPSEITPSIFANLLKISEPAWGENGPLYWRERSSSLTKIQMIAPGSEEIQTISGDLNVGGELLYGGGGYSTQENSLIVVDKTTHQLHRINPEKPTADQLTSSLLSAASPRLSPDGKYVLFVHSDGDIDAIYIKGLFDSLPARPLVSGSDFYNYPRWHPANKQIAWISWDHPHMPWDESYLWLADLDSSTEIRPDLVSKTLVAGGDGISVLQPEFSPDGRNLAYISEQDGWWQIFLLDLQTGEKQQLTNDNAEHGLPAWLQDQQSFQFNPDSSLIYFLRNKEGIRTLWTLDLDSNKEKMIQLDENYTWLEDITISPDGDRLALIASGADLPVCLITVNLEGRTKIVRHSAPVLLPTETFSIPEPISWKGQEGEEAHGLFYSPQNPQFKGEGKPPLIIIIHSGPTRQKWMDFQTRTQYFTSRGYAVLEVNYRGSTGYGRDYRQALKGNWGVTDVDDCLSGAIHLAEKGLVDREKMIVMGSSSGGMTVYQILVKYPGIFRAGVSLYGIVNHLSLLQNPPKFERHYSDWLIGPYPEAEELYHQRSPIFFADNIQDPVAVFQGGKDRIVPQDQAEQIVSALEENQVPYLYRLYPDEGHSFKQISTQEDFYSQLETFLETHLSG